MNQYGNHVQNEIYQRKVRPSIPFRFEELELKAREKLEDGPFYYVAGGAGGEDTMRANRNAFDRWQIVPRMLNNVENRDLKVTLWGDTYSSPLMLAPIGVQSIVHPDGELASARAASSMNVPFIASSASTYSMEEIASVMGNSPRWFQLYWSNDREIAASMLRRAEASGYSAIVVTLDASMMAWRESDLENAYLPFLSGEGVGNYVSDPVFRSMLKDPPEVDDKAAAILWSKVFGNASLTWDDLHFLRDHTSLPILLKGILHPEDAKLAIDHGMDGIIVSNHGGRQVDGAVGALDSLPVICQVVNGRIPVLFDSGIRRGADVVKALALGASSVLLGRPYMYGLTLAGEQGVKDVIRNILADLDLTMALSGQASVSELGPSLLTDVKDASFPSRIERPDSQYAGIKS
ncbi:lactate 2-monooxygenase [Rossellomorea aquimaris]|uniref:L-lactate oxidase n=1 Tax=Rossellomorea aquimaris TaxID=189382 RepID=A0A366ESJ8_9BACI|nr:lactate 2-monooxygenase [Rossellomorea aquimaris]RBP05367.1 isopentenyl diphosphate isomerase/L-lactate dehydrogenase-like FMN-dependent dehydrogenase [Rossellomorea aquimaris]